MTDTARMLFRTTLRVANDVVSLMSLTMRSRAQLAAENLFLRKQLALYLERQVKPRHADDATPITLGAVAVRGLAPSLDDRQAGHACSLASKRIPAIVALEIERARTSADSSGAAPTDRDDGNRESHLGRGTNCRRAPREAWDSSVAAHG